jgi:hypothetical protein
MQMEVSLRFKNIATGSEPISSSGTEQKGLACVGREFVNIFMNGRIVQTGNLQVIV